MCLHDSLYCVMQQDHILKKLNFELLTPRISRVCGLNICYQVAAFVIPLNMICNMTLF